MHSRNKLYVVDLDNTLYDTWPTLINRRKYFNRISPLHELVRTFNLPAFTKLIGLIRKRVTEYDIVFLSARHILHYPLTYIKLVAEFRTFKFKLILVDSAAAKIPHIVGFSREYKRLTVLDDFSYGHEFGCIQRYNSVIKSIQMQNVTIITGSKLIRLQTNH